MKACYKCVRIPVSWNHYGLSWRLIIRIGYPVNKTYKGSLVFLSYFGIFYTLLPLLWQRFLIQLSLSHTSTWSCFLWLSSIGCMLVLKQDVQTTQLHNVAYYFFFFLNFSISSFLELKFFLLFKVYSKFHPLNENFLNLTMDVFPFSDYRLPSL